MCELPSIPGKFMPDKAKALGVQRGPLWGQLKAGQPAPGTEGRMVQPHEVGALAVACCAAKRQAVHEASRVTRDCMRERLW